ncbi:MAG TPA: hypothetical protein V6C81_31935 [Planktothrix sp.]
MLSMTVLCVGLLLFACIIGFAFYMLLSEQQRAQTKTDELALDIAKTMNESDKIGELNNLEELNRELVYTSRLVSNATQARDLYFCSPLAQQLLDEARSSSQDIEKARVDQIELTRKSIRYAVDNYNLHTRTGAVLMLPWWQSYDPQISAVSVGYIDGVASNVLHNDVWPDLNDWDKERNARQVYVQKKSNLYLGNINAKLPDQDNDVPFNFASLPAPVDTTIAPPRLANPEVFKPTGDIFADGKYPSTKILQIPSAVKVTAVMEVNGASHRENVQVSSVAAANGAIPMPPDVDINKVNGNGTNGNEWGKKTW